MPVSIPNKEGKISVYAEENENYVEISIQDNGLGLSVEDKERILSEKVYDSEKLVYKIPRMQQNFKRIKDMGSD